MQIKPLKELAEEAFKELYLYQSGEKKIVKTGEDMIDSHIGGLLPGDIVIFSALPGHGKSETLFRMKEKILDKEVNENADNYVFLDMSLEMKIFNIILRGINRKLFKKKRDIIFNEFSKEEKKKVKKYYKSLQDDRQYINQSPTTPEEFYSSCKKFLKEHKDKDAVFIAIDHILLLSGADKQNMIEEIIEHVNQLKLQFGNAYFIVLSQGNRALLGRVAERNNNSAPNASDVYGSSFMDQISSYNIFIYNPYKTGIQTYMKVNPDRYDYLSEFFSEEDHKGRVSFDTTAKLFYHVLKTRESDAPFKDIFIKEMDIPEADKEKMRFVEKENKKEDIIISSPKFEEKDPVSFEDDDEGKQEAPF